MWSEGVWIRPVWSRSVPCSSGLVFRNLRGSCALIPKGTLVHVERTSARLDEPGTELDHTRRMHVVWERMDPPSMVSFRAMLVRSSVSQSPCLMRTHT